MSWGQPSTRAGCREESPTSSSHLRVLSELAMLRENILVGEIHPRQRRQPACLSSPPTLAPDAGCGSGEASSLEATFMSPHMQTCTFLRPQSDPMSTQLHLSLSLKCISSPAPKVLLMSRHFHLPARVLKSAWKTPCGLVPTSLFWLIPLFPSSCPAARGSTPCSPSRAMRDLRSSWSLLFSWTDCPPPPTLWVG